MRKKFKAANQRQIWLELINSAPINLLNLEQLTNDEKLKAIISYKEKYADTIIEKYQERNDDFS